MPRLCCFCDDSILPPSGYPHVPHCVITCTRSSMFTVPSLLLSAGIVPGAPVWPQLVMTSTRSSMLTWPSPLGMGYLSAVHGGGGVYVIVTFGAYEPIGTPTSVNSRLANFLTV